MNNLFGLAWDDGRRRIVAAAMVLVLALTMAAVSFSAAYNVASGDQVEQTVEAGSSWSNRAFQTFSTFGSSWS
ncbi:MAG: hypothetical protein OEO77_09380 [Acidimicrobiia bacterium]|nr:hypothetical protein [Acidimicrobiia bacterium]